MIVGKANPAAARADRRRKSRREGFGDRSRGEFIGVARDSGRVGVGIVVLLGPTIIERGPPIKRVGRRRSPLWLGWLRVANHAKHDLR